MTLSSLLDEADGAGELVSGAAGTGLLPLSLTARAGGKPTSAIYETASGVRPTVWAEVKIRDPKTGLMEATIKVDRATIPVGPASCAAGTTRLRTTMSLEAGGGSAVALDVVLPWRCVGAELKTP